MANLAIFASGSGTNAENLIRHFEHHKSIKVALVVTNRAGAGVVERAERLNVPVVYMPKADMGDEELVLETLRAYSVDWIILAGYLLLVPGYLIGAFPDRILNIHPALLPKFGGKGMYGSHVHEAVVKAGEKESGITVHLVNNEYDRGKVVFQKAVPVSEGDTPETVAKKVQELEHRYFPEIVEKAVGG